MGRFAVPVPGTGYDDVTRMCRMCARHRAQYAAGAMDPARLRSPANAAVLDYLYVEQLPQWRGSKSPWVVEGYSLATHPDLCERVEEINAAAGPHATFRYLYGRPALVADNGVVVAFATGTHIFCVRLPASECDPDLLARPELLPPSPYLRQRRRELEALTAHEWTRLDPYTVNVPTAEGLERLAAHVGRAVERSHARDDDHPLQ